MSLSDMKELGSSGLNRQGGIVYEEYLRELQGSRWFDTVREMQDHPIVAAMLYLVEMQVRQVIWPVKPANESKAAVKWADHVESCFGDMSFTWADTMSDVVTFFPYGFAALELVYKIRGGQTGKAETDSRYDDGLIGWRQWVNRPQDTISWQFDAHGGIQGIVQNDPYAIPAAKEVPIPIDKLLLFRTTTGGKNNPEGRSVLRPAYSSFYMAQNLARVQAIFYERLNGVPWARVPSQVLSSTATVAQQNILTEMKKIVVNLRIDEQAGLVTPSDRDENGNLYYDLELLRADTSAGYDIEATIIRNERRILMTMLAGAIMLGHDGVGSNALGATNMDMFWTGVDASVGSIAEVINRHAIPKLMRLNSVKPELWPTVVPGSVERVDLDKLGQYVVRLAGSGFDLTDPELQKYVLRQANMPVSNNLEKGIVVRPPVAGAAADAGGSAIAATKQRNTQGEGKN